MKAPSIHGQNRNTSASACSSKKSSRGKVRSDVPYGDLAADEQALVVKAIHDSFAEVETKKYKVTCVCF